jgi:uncharacterized protein (TIGR03437 family)
MVDVTSGNTMFTTTTLEGRLSTVSGNGRSAISARGMVVDSAGATAYMLTTSGITVTPMTPQSPATAPVLSNNGVVNAGNYQATLAPGGLASIFGKQLAQNATSSANPLPTVMGGVCVTMNNQPLPLLMTSGTQISAQIPPSLVAGRYPVVVRAIDRQIPSQTSLVSVSKYAPAVLLDANGQTLLFHQDGTQVTKDHKAQRDEPLAMYATGLGVTTGGKVTAGVPAPSNPLAVTQPVQVFFGNPGYSQAAIIVDWSGLVPGMVGVYRMNLRVPGNHLKGDALPIQVRIGGVFSATTGTNVPYAAVE